MTDTLLSPISGPQAGAPDAARSAAKLNQDFDDFLLLLTTQMQNQDPLSPTDSTEFTNQLVAFAQVEQQIASNDHLENLITFSQASQNQAALSYLGLEVRYAGSDFDFDGSQPVNLSVGVAPGAVRAEMLFTNEDGDLIRKQQGPYEAGLHRVSWDGRNDEGEFAEPGTYNVRYNAYDIDGDLIDTATAVFGTVSGIESTDEGVILMIGERPVKMNDVLSARPQGAVETPIPQG